jgi:uncharacterized membrane protein YuzA (DUF378 family)
MLSTEYIRKKFFAVAMVLLVVGGLNLGLSAITGKDFLTVVLGRGTLIVNILFFAIGVAALGIAFFRDSYLPFLGPTVMPCSLLAVSTPEGADHEIRVLVKPGQKVIYWAAEPENKDIEQIVDWRKAYLGFRNAGVSVADQDGYATLKVRKPQPYQVPMRKLLSPHIHYRVCVEDGMVGSVQTVTLDGKEYFENLVDYEGFDSEEEGIYEGEYEGEAEGEVEGEYEGFANEEDEGEVYGEGEFEGEYEGEGEVYGEEELEGFENEGDEEEVYGEYEGEGEGEGEGIYGGEDEFEGFRAALPPGEEEGFANSMFKGQYEPVPASSFNVVDPKTAQEEINAIVNTTARQSLMTQAAAVDVSPNRHADNLASVDFK